MTTEHCGVCLGLGERKLDSLRVQHAQFGSEFPFRVPYVRCDVDTNDRQKWNRFWFYCATSSDTFYSHSNRPPANFCLEYYTLHSGRWICTFAFMEHLLQYSLNLSRISTRNVEQQARTSRSHVRRVTYFAAEAIDSDGMEWKSTIFPNAVLIIIIGNLHISPRECNRIRLVAHCTAHSRTKKVKVKQKWYFRRLFWFRWSWITSLRGACTLRWSSNQPTDSLSAERAKCERNNLRVFTFSYAIAAMRREERKNKAMGALCFLPFPLSPPFNITMRDTYVVRVFCSGRNWMHRAAQCNAHLFKQKTENRCSSCSFAHINVPETAMAHLTTQPCRRHR